MFQSSTSCHLTGSRVYGTPRDDSDLDLCILVSDDEYNQFLVTADRDPDGDRVAGSECGTAEWSRRTRSFRFGRLNVLVTTSRKMYEAWQKATDELRTAHSIIGPVTREQAIKVSQKFEKEVR
jgi:hypothetical protein